MGSPPSAVMTSPGALDVFWKGTDGDLWHTWYTGGTSWNGPASLGFGPLGSAPVAAGQPSGTIDVFWKGTNTALWHSWYTGAWHGPEHLGGTITS